MPPTHSVSESPRLRPLAQALGPWRGACSASGSNRQCACSSRGGSEPVTSSTGRVAPRSSVPVPLKVPVGFLRLAGPYFYRVCGRAGVGVRNRGFGPNFALSGWRRYCAIRRDRTFCRFNWRAAQPSRLGSCRCLVRALARPIISSQVAEQRSFA